MTTKKELDFVVGLVREYQATNNLSAEDLKVRLIEEKFKKAVGDNSKADNLLLNVSKNDKSYIDLFCEMYPVFHSKKGMFKDERPKGYDTLTHYLYKSIQELLDSSKGNGVIEDGVREDITLVEGEKTYDDLKKMKYIAQLDKRGYKLITDTTEIAGNIGVHSTMLAIFKSVYTFSPIKALNLSDKANLSNKEVLESLGLNASSVNLWDEKVYTRDEDLAFRLFIREDSTSFTVLLKLPMGMDNFALNNVKGGVNPLLDAVPLVLSNSNTNKGDVYNSTFLEAPKLLNMKNTQKVDCPYDCIKFVLVKDLLKFKEDDWLLRDYIQQARGIRKDTKYKDFEELPLGQRIVAGVYPGGLQSQEFICKKDISAGFLCGGAGSGKTAMFDSILVQSLAHEGNAGDGGLILLDAKKEWVGVWLDLFKKRGIQLYGFDGEVLPEDELKMEVQNKKGETEIVKVPFEVLRCTAGAIFIDTLYNLIQNMLQGTNTKYDNILEYNEGGANYKGLGKIPRITILLDEINTMYGYMEGTKETKRIFKAGLIRAKLTRTSGFIWFLGGQDISRSIVASDERSNYKYSIVGSLDPTRYEYYDVDVNQSIVDYEKRNSTEDKPYPIMSQGVFYAGSKGRTSIVKCMYLPSKERSDALDDLQIPFEGMRQLDKLVKFALKEGLFDKYNGLVGGKNNIVYSALKSIGAITQEEFDFYTERLFGGKSEEEQEALDTFNNSVDIEAINNLLEEESRGDESYNLNETPYGEPIEDYAQNNVHNHYIDNRPTYEEAEYGSGLYYDDEDDDGDDYDGDGDYGSPLGGCSLDISKDGNGSRAKDIMTGAMIGAGGVKLGSAISGGSNYVDNYSNISDTSPSGSYNQVDVEDSNVVQFPTDYKGEVTTNYQYGSAVPDEYELPIDDFSMYGEHAESVRQAYSYIPKNDPVYVEKVKSPNRFSGCDMYDSKIEVPVNPFDSKASETIFGGINAFKYYNDLIVGEIKKAFHSLDRIDSVHIAENGLFINNIAFRPKFPANVVNSMPMDIRGEIARGNVTEFFPFNLLFKLTNLTMLAIDNVRLAEGRVRRELGMEEDMTWDLLYEKQNFRSLRHLEIGGQRITTPEEAKKYAEEGQGYGYKFQERVRDAFELPSDMFDRVKSPVQKLWSSRPVTIVTGALGGVVGTKVVLGMASMMGGWGILFTGLAGLGAYNTYVKRRGRG